jgi:hypothetical protein
LRPRASGCEGRWEALDAEFFILGSLVVPKTCPDGFRSTGSARGGLADCMSQAAASGASEDFVPRGVLTRWGAVPHRKVRALQKKDAVRAGPHTRRESTSIVGTGIREKTMHRVILDGSVTKRHADCSCRCSCGESLFAKRFSLGRIGGVIHWPE